MAITVVGGNSRPTLQAPPNQPEVTDRHLGGRLER